MKRPLGWHSSRKTKVSPRFRLPGLAEALTFPLSLFTQLTTGPFQRHALHCLSLCFAIPCGVQDPISAPQHLIKVQLPPSLLEPLQESQSHLIQIPVAHTPHPNAPDPSAPTRLFPVSPHSKYCSSEIYLLDLEGEMQHWT